MAWNKSWVCEQLTWNLASNGGADFGFCVFEELDKGGHQVTADDLFINCLCNLRGC